MSLPSNAQLSPERLAAHPVWVHNYRHMGKVKVETHLFSGGLWCAAWLFTIGFLKLSFWEGVFAIVIWPYYLGVTFAPFAVGAIY